MKLRKERRIITARCNSTLGSEVEFKRFILFFFLKNSLTKKIQKGKIQYNISNCMQKQKHIKTRYKCLLTGRSQFVNMHGRLSRLAFRYISGIGLIRGVSRTGF